MWDSHQPLLHEPRKNQKHRLTIHFAGSATEPHRQIADEVAVLRFIFPGFSNWSKRTRENTLLPSLQFALYRAYINGSGSLCLHFWTAVYELLSRRRGKPKKLQQTTYFWRGVCCKSTHSQDQISQITTFAKIHKNSLEHLTFKLRSSTAFNLALEI